MMSRTMEHIARIVAPATIGAVMLTGCNKMSQATPSQAPVVERSAAAPKLTMEQRYRGEAAALTGKILAALSVADTYDTSYFGAETTKTYCVTALSTAMRPNALTACINPKTGEGSVSVVGDNPTIKDGIDSLKLTFDGQKLTNKYDSNLAMIKDGIDADTLRPTQLVGREGMLAYITGNSVLKVSVEGPFWALNKFEDTSLSGSYMPKSPENELPATTIMTEGDTTDRAISESFTRLQTQLLPD